MLAGASLVGQVAAVGRAARGSGAVGSSGTAAGGTGATSPKAPRCTSVARRCLQACKCF
jgi:hypothetical protein